MQIVIFRYSPYDLHCWGRRRPLWAGSRNLLFSASLALRNSNSASSMKMNLDTLEKVSSILFDALRSRGLQENWPHCSGGIGFHWPSCGRWRQAGTLERCAMRCESRAPSGRQGA